MQLAPTELLEHGPELTWLCIRVPTALFSYVAQTSVEGDTHALQVFASQLGAMFMRLDADAWSGGLREFVTTPSRHREPEQT